VGGRAVGLAVGNDPYIDSYLERWPPLSSFSLLSSLELDCEGLAAPAVPDPVADDAAFLCLQLVAAGPLPDPVPDAAGAGAAATSGFTLLPPLALAKSQEKASCPVCCRMETDLSSEFLGPFDGLNA
jgi:hypothetical protein